MCDEDCQVMRYAALGPSRELTGSKLLCTYAGKHANSHPCCCSEVSAPGYVQMELAPWARGGTRKATAGVCGRTSCGPAAVKVACPLQLRDRPQSPAALWATEGNLNPKGYVDIMDAKEVSTLVV